jgi:hypothetical protein
MSPPVPAACQYHLARQKIVYSASSMRAPKWKSRGGKLHIEKKAG